jgi:Meckel syndrome type 1 protein
MHSARPYLLLQINSVDEWARHRIEGYGFVRFPDTPGYHQITVNTWRPRASLDTEIHSFFLGGSVRIQKIEELVRTRYVSSDDYDDIVNRFGLETEDAGKVTVNINICSQDQNSRKTRKSEFNLLKEKEKLETRKLVMKYRLKLEKDTKKERGARFD